MDDGTALFFCALLLPGLPPGATEAARDCSAEDAGPDGTKATSGTRTTRPYRRSADRNNNLIAVESFDTVRGLLKEHKAETLLEIGEVIDKVGVSHLREIVRLLS